MSTRTGTQQVGNGTGLGRLPVMEAWEAAEAFDSRDEGTMGSDKDWRAMKWQRTKFLVASLVNIHYTLF